MPLDGVALPHKIGEYATDRSARISQSLAVLPMCVEFHKMPGILAVVWNLAWNGKMRGICVDFNILIKSYKKHLNNLFTHTFSVDC
jgi:hypothetical protein